jgi:hypothetical protein
MHQDLKIAWEYKGAWPKLVVTATVPTEDAERIAAALRSDLNEAAKRLGQRYAEQLTHRLLYGESLGEPKGIFAGLT